MGEKPYFFNSREVLPADEKRIREVIQHSHERLPFGAVSFDPYHAIHPESSRRRNKQETYAPKSLKNVDRIVKGNYLRAIKEGTLQAADTETLEKLFHMVHASVMLAQTERMEHHHRHSVESLPIVRTVEVIAAEMGLATPTELLTILMDNPNLESIELAKQTHPFVSNDTRGMKRAVGEALSPYRNNLVANNWQVRTKVKGINEDLPAAIVVTKRPIATIDLGNGEFIEVIERLGNLARGDEMVKNMTHPPIDRLIRNRDHRRGDKKARHPELANLVTDAVRNWQSPPWLVDMTTSIYAHRIVTK